MDDGHNSEGIDIMKAHCKPQRHHYGDWHSSHNRHLVFSLRFNRRLYGFNCKIRLQIRLGQTPFSVPLNQEMFKATAIFEIGVLGSAFTHLTPVSNTRYTYMDRSPVPPPASCMLPQNISLHGQGPAQSALCTGE